MDAYQQPTIEEYTRDDKFNDIHRELIKQGFVENNPRTRKKKVYWLNGIKIPLLLENRKNELPHGKTCYLTTLPIDRDTKKVGHWKTDGTFDNWKFDYSSLYNMDYLIDYIDNLNWEIIGKNRKGIDVYKMPIKDIITHFKVFAAIKI